MILRVWVPGWPAIPLLVAMAFVIGGLAAWEGPQPAEAQVGVSSFFTYVSATGADSSSSTCQRSTPCATFAFAASRTIDGGILSCADAGNYGGLTITSSITISCPPGMGNISTTGSGVVINDPSGGAKVLLRGLTITHLFHLDLSSPSDTGITFTNGASLILEDVVISGFTSRGIFVPGKTIGGNFIQLSVNDSLIADNGIGQPGGGGMVLGQVPPTAPNAGVIRATLNNVSLTRNNIGLRVSPNTEVTVKSSTFESNISFNLVAFTGGGPSFVNVEDSMFSESIGGTGIHAEGSGSVIKVSRSIISGNNIGLATVNLGQILSAGNNVVQNNFGGNGVFTGNFPLQ